MTRTITTYLIESHIDECTATDPANCDAKGHWWLAREAADLDEVEEIVEGDDAPATRVTEIKKVVTSRVIQRRNSPLPVG